MTIAPPVRNEEPSRRGRRKINRILENDLIRKVSFSEYQRKVQRVYGGPRGAFLATASLLSLHQPLGERMLRKRRFDLRGAKDILDVGAGAGQITRHLLKYADPSARITGIDLSHEMLRRARRRMNSARPQYIAADLTQLPFKDQSFDCITCGYVLEHLSDARDGLAELSRVLVPGGRLLLLTTEDNFGGAWTSRVWYCRTYNRRELRAISHEAGLEWKQELWFSRMHRMFKAGGICVEMERAPA